MKNQDANLYSDEMNEIVGQIPPFLMKYGIFIFIAILLLIGGVSWVVWYPEIVAGKGTIYAMNAPKTVSPKLGGQIARLLVQEGDTVNPEQTLAIMKSLAEYEEVEKLSSHVKQWYEAAQNEEWSKINVLPSDYKNIGELQTAFQSFYLNYVQARNFIFNGNYVVKKNMLLRSILYNDSLKHNLLKQKSIYENDYQLSDSDFKAQQYLYKERVIAKSEFTAQESKLLAKKVPLENVESNILNNRITMISKEQERMDLDDRYNQYSLSFNQALNNLWFAIGQWKQQYILSATAGGRVVFQEMIQEGQEVDAGKALFYIESLDQNCFAQVKVPQSNFGKLQLNQPVRLALPSYPSQEYGRLSGKVTYISRMPDKDMNYMVKVFLTDGLVSDRGFHLAFSNELQADAEIVTGKERIINKLMAAMNSGYKK